MARLFRRRAHLSSLAKQNLASRLLGSAVLLLSIDSLDDGTFLSIAEQTLALLYKKTAQGHHVSARHSATSPYQ